MQVLVHETTETVQKRGGSDGGVHWHQLVREKQATAKDGSHSHIFLLPDGSLIYTTESGGHQHKLASDVARETADGGAHAHDIVLPNGDRLQTSTDGAHSHEALVRSTPVDGQHVHVLKLPDGSVLTSLDGAQFWAQVEQKEPQANQYSYPPYMPASYGYGETMGSLRLNVGQSVGKAQKEKKPYQRTVTWARREKSISGFPTVCLVCKAQPASAEIFQDTLESWLDACQDCADVIVPKSLQEEPAGTDLDGWLGWPRLSDIAKRANESIQGPWQSEVEILKLDDEERVITGIVLEPNEVDGQNDTVSPEVIRKAAYNFASQYGKIDGTKLGLMHKRFGSQVGFELVESYITKTAMKINGKSVKKGSWLMSVRAVTDASWEAVKTKKLTGFSIGGLAAVLEPEPAAV